MLSALKVHIQNELYDMLYLCFNAAKMYGVLNADKNAQLLDAQGLYCQIGVCLT